MSSKLVLGGVHSDVDVCDWIVRARVRERERERGDLKAQHVP